MPSIAIYGVEDAPAFLRFAGARSNNDPQKPLYEIDDTKSVNLVNKFANISNTMVDNCWLISDLSWFYNIPLAIYNKWAAGQWQVSADFYGGQLQTGCDFLIGAKRNGYQAMTYTDWVCKFVDPLAKMPHLKKLACNWPEDYYPVEVTVMVPTIISTPSDGLIPIDSEKALPGCNANNKYEALHANHEELKNHQSVTILLNDIFNGTKSDIRYPDFFKVDPK